MLMVNAEALIERQMQIDNGDIFLLEEDVRALLHLLWNIREMDINECYSMTGLFRIMPKRNGDFIEIARVTAPKILALLEKWSGEIREFLDHPEGAGEGNP